MDPDFRIGLLGTSLADLPVVESSAEAELMRDEDVERRAAPGEPFGVVFLCSKGDSFAFSVESIFDGFSNGDSPEIPDLIAKADVGIGGGRRVGLPFFDPLAEPGLEFEGSRIPEDGQERQGRQPGHEAVREQTSVDDRCDLPRPWQEEQVVTVLDMIAGW